MGGLAKENAVGGGSGRGGPGTIGLEGLKTGAVGLNLDVGARVRDVPMAWTPDLALMISE